MSGAHPRSRGENLIAPEMIDTNAGSSPLTRGKRISPLDNLGQIRLIPAHAGKTTSFPAWELNPQAHPRSRGENHSKRLSTGLGSGSSPLTRGKPVKRFQSGELDRLIPAHAGKTSYAAVKRFLPRAHPRSRGENVLPRLPSADFAGSSPLTRGKQLATSIEEATGRLIPAHAGKTVLA